jgi:hypothetical protein
MKKVFVIVLLFTLFLEADPSKQEVGTIINLSGKQRMLTQKMSKEALLIGKGIDVKKNREVLKATIALFDKTLKGLIQGDKDLKLPKTEDKKIIKELQSITSLWKEFKVFIDRVASGNFQRTALKAIEMGNIPLLKSMNHVVNMYEKKYTSQLSAKTATTINLAGKERMLIQKMTKELLLIAHHLESNTYMSSLKEGGDFFKDTLVELIQDKDAMKNPQVIKEIQEIKKLWDQYQESIINTELSKKGIHKFNKQEKVFIEKMTSKLIKVATEIDKKRYQDELKKSASEFEQILNGLIQGDTQLDIFKTSNRKIQEELSKIKKMWYEYKEIIIHLDTSTKALKKAMHINMPLVENIDKVVKLYELENR